MENYTTGTGQKLLVHSKEDCSGESCCIHKPSNHSMNGFPTYWREDRHLMERICSHGIGHPDPDDLLFKKVILGWSKEKFHYEAVHGCDGCCK